MMKTAAAALVTCVLLAACSRNSSKAPPTSPEAAGNRTLREADSAAIRALRGKSAQDIASFHARIASLDRSALPDPDRLPGVRLRLGLQGFAIPGREIAATAAATAPTASVSRAAPDGLGNPPGGLFFEGDSAWFVYADTAKGRLIWIHLFHDSEEDLHALVRDSLVYRWPYDSAATILVSSDTHILTWPDGELRIGLADEDGDGTLNGSRPGSPVRIRKERETIRPDTIVKSSWMIETGNAADSLGEGIPVALAETTFIGGRPVRWTQSRDGDGDGFLLRAQAGRRVKVAVDAFVRNPDGTATYSSEIRGPGADGDYAAAADNPLYSYGLAVLSDRGDTLSVSRIYDGDGDGYVADPAAGRSERVWVATRRLDREGYRSYSDSALRTWHGAPIDSANGTDTLYAYTALGMGIDGSETRIACKPQPGKTGFSGQDTVAVEERIIYPADGGTASEASPYLARADAGAVASTGSAALAVEASVAWETVAAAAQARDSAVRSALIIPGAPADPADDHILWWSEKTWYGRGGAVAWVLQTFAPAPADASPELAGADARHGTWVRQAEYARASAPGLGAVKSVWRSDVFDLAGQEWRWDERRYAAGNDSTVERGRLLAAGVIAYARMAAGVSASGRYDANTRAFADTTLSALAHGEEAGIVIRQGFTDGSGGTVEYSSKYLPGSGNGNGDSSVVRIVLSQADGRLKVAIRTGTDSCVYLLHGDTATWAERRGDTAATFMSIARGDGSYALLEQLSAGDGTVLTQGDFHFGKDGSGAGTLRIYPQGGSPDAAQGGTEPATAITFRSDGAILIDGMRWQAAGAPPRPAGADHT